MKLYPTRENDARPVESLAITKKLDPVETEVIKACSELAEASECYRLTREKAIHKAYASRFDDLQQQGRQQLVLPDDALKEKAIQPERHSSNLKDIGIDYHKFDNTVTAKKQQFAEEMRIKEDQRRALQILRQKEEDDLYRDRSNSKIEKETEALAGDNAPMQAHQMGFLHRLVTGRIFGKTS